MKHKLTLRTRTAIWFTLSVLGITVLFFTALYFITSSRLNGLLEEDLTLALSQLSSQVEQKQERLIFEDETPIKAGISYYIMEKNGSELFSRGEDIVLFDEIPVSEGSFTHVHLSGSEWLMLDSKPIAIDSDTIRIRVVTSYGQMYETLKLFEAVFLLGVPVMTFLAALIGFLLARRSLQPIHRIISCADIITRGDLTQRIPEEPVHDELGELTRTLNRMLASLEDSFSRERRFTSDASHELRTPIAVIRAYAESLLTDTSLSAAHQENVEVILSECRKIQRVIEQMLTLTRAQEHRYPIEMEQICLNNVLDGVLQALRPIADAKSITLHFAADDRIELTADQSLMTQLLLNLTENAVKYGKNGGDVWVNAVHSGSNTRLTVADNGIGISAENLPHIFERFFRADASRDRTGTGLGLSIAEWIVTVHGGTIHVESKLKEGTTFVVTLPNQTGKLPRNLS